MKQKYFWMLIVFLLIIIIGLVIVCVSKEISDMWVKEDIKSPETISPLMFNLTEDYLTINLDNITFFNITSGVSMFPAIHHNSILLYRLLGNNSIYIGDVIRYKYKKDVFVHHRVIDVREDNEGIYYITKGDNIPNNDIIRVRRENITHKLIGILY